MRINSNLIDSVQQLRAYKGLTVTQLANISGLCPTTIRNIERGRHLPTFTTIKRLAEVFEVSPLDIITGKASLMVSELL